MEGRQSVIHGELTYLRNKSVVPVQPLRPDDGHEKWCNGA